MAATCTSGPSPLTCTAAYPTATLAVGTYVITATEAADSTYPQGVATALLTVEANASVPTSPILTTGSNVSSVLVPYGTPSATLTANIQFNGPVPTGAVSFTVNDGSGNTALASCVQGSANSLTCTATWQTGSLGIGSYLIQVTEAADANYTGGHGDWHLDGDAGCRGDKRCGLGYGDVWIRDDSDHGDDPLRGQHGTFGRHHGGGYPGQHGDPSRLPGARRTAAY